MLLTFFHFFEETPIKKWTSMNIVKYYREEDHQIELNLILNDVNKHLRRIANGNVYGFEESKKKKAEDIISNWGTWTAPAKEKDRKKQNNKKMIQMENENVFEAVASFVGAATSLWIDAGVQVFVVSVGTVE
ncbi:hypothetical protein F8M41_018279 [Gigaspora margarita]|uniref:Uncharacterized protein n=1 Tax=Gigaspora margarita TaxID=4874 RepID=A0A8H4ELJ6_GIGMA|nr:hypothetical protein F8M41_018279 [Gigaspora margarita]